MYIIAELLLLVMQVGREVALGFTSRYFTLFLPALLQLVIPNTPENCPITYSNITAYSNFHEVPCYKGGHPPTYRI